MKKRLFVGIDTSNYTTSAALCDEAGNVLCNAKLLLPVAEGERGLRQSDAVFHHVRNLPTVMAQLRQAVADVGKDGEIVAIGVSARPRDAEGSYMPCFLSGMAAAETALTVLASAASAISVTSATSSASSSAAAEAAVAASKILPAGATTL